MRLDVYEGQKFEITWREGKLSNAGEGVGDAFQVEEGRVREGI
jgi:hypothetical protein